MSSPSGELGDSPKRHIGECEKKTDVAYNSSLNKFATKDAAPQSEPRVGRGPSLLRTFSQESATTALSSITVWGSDDDEHSNSLESIYSPASSESPSDSTQKEEGQHAPTIKESSDQDKSSRTCTDSPQHSDSTCKITQTVDSSTVTNEGSRSNEDRDRLENSPIACIQGNRCVLICTCLGFQDDSNPKLDSNPFPMFHGTMSWGTTMVETEEDLAAFLPNLAKFKKGTQNSELAEDCEGCEGGMSGSGTITYFTLSCKSLKHAWVFDVYTLKHKIFDTPSEEGLTLRSIIESLDYLHLFFDDRMDSLALFLKYNVKLGCVRDIQLMKVAARLDDPRVRIRGLGKSKNRGKVFFEENEKGWDALIERPLSKTAKEYVEGDTACLFDLEEAYGSRFSAVAEEAWMSADRLLSIVDEESMNRVAVVTNPEYDQSQHKLYTEVVFQDLYGAHGWIVGNSKDLLTPWWQQRDISGMAELTSAALVPAESDDAQNWLHIWD
ncbi:uncharacterized protein PAC_06045 [Phialocephala subalpina]|uniref:3'-5' exonuclease domain-containing protein n=1 Tax=Phialocephala subalpina TaxID=576137 RepID=A0A1L7WTP3_9HELO|nr:uncharacterized protein PAC_06045 [Phialocephala subalpina]